MSKNTMANDRRFSALKRMRDRVDYGVELVGKEEPLNKDPKFPIHMCIYCANFRWDNETWGEDYTIKSGRNVYSSQQVKTVCPECVDYVIDLLQPHLRKRVSEFAGRLNDFTLQHTIPKSYISMSSSVKEETEDLCKDEPKEKEEPEEENILKKLW